MELKIKGLLPIVIVVVLAFFTLIVYPIWFVIPRLQDNVLDYQMNSLKHQLDSAMTMVKFHFSNYVDGLMDEATAKQRALQHLKIIFYGPEGKDYFFVLSLDGVLLAHPYRTELEGQNGLTSSNPVFAKAVRAILEAARQGKEWAEYERYVYGEEKVERKISAIRIFEPWGWIVGTGLYGETLSEQFGKIVSEFRRVMFVFGVTYFVIFAIFLGALSRYHGERERLLHLLSREKERLQTIIASIPQPVVVLRDSQILFMNQTFRDMFVQGDGQSLSLEPSLSKKLEGLVEETKKKRQDLVTTVQIDIDPEKKWFRVHAVPLFVDEKIVETVFLMTEITEQIKMIDFWKSKAETDPLTGLANRNVLEELFQNWHILGEKFSVIMLDLDGFKDINDEYGHDVGDLVLKEFAKRLIENARKDTISLRYGGDEVLLILPGSDKQTGLKVARRLQEALKDPVNLENLSLTMSASAGIAHFPEDGQDLRTLISVADERLYKAKSLGRGSLCSD